MQLMGIGLALIGLTAVAAAEPLTAGVYKGKYEGSAGASGDFRVTLDDSGGKWSGKVMFTLQGQDVNCKVTSIQVNGARLKIVYTFDLQGTVLESSIDGEMSGGTLGGKYHTQVSGDGTAVDDGTWTTKSAGKDG